MRIKKVLSAFVCAVLCMSIAFSMSSCNINSKSASGKKTGPVTADEYRRISAEELLERYVKKQKKVSLDEYTALLSTLSFVKISDNLELEDNITSRALQILGNQNSKLPNDKSVIKALIKSKSPQVRGFAVTLTGALPDEKGHLNILKNTVKSEKDPYVLKCALETLAYNGEYDSETGSFIIKMTEHENAKVRLQAVYALGNQNAVSVNGAADAIIRSMSDKDPDVRKIAYKCSGELHDEKIIEPIVKMLNNPEEAEYHAYGLLALTAMWYDYPAHVHTSEAAYKATVNYYKTVRRSENVPSVSAVSALAEKNTKTFDSWKAGAAYYNAKELTDTMAVIALDAAVSWRTRVAALKVIKTHGTKADLEALKAQINAMNDEQADPVKTEYGKLIK